MTHRPGRAHRTSAARRARRIEAKAHGETAAEVFGEGTQLAVMLGDTPIVVPYPLSVVDRDSIDED